MKTGISIRVMGVQSTRETIAAILRRAEDAGVESAWIVDHIAIPPDDAEGSGGRYLDPLATLAWMAGQTSRIRIGTSVLILPYRPKLPTAKAIATIQELSAGRLLLGVGVGWMKPEFRALGIDRRQRGRLTDETLAFLNDCFSADEVALNGQPFLFRPRPEKPPIYVGGSAPHAHDRAIRYADGWMPMGRLEDNLADIAAYRQRSRAEKGVAGEVVTFASLPEGDTGAARAVLDRYAEAGVDRVIIGRRYETADDWAGTLDTLAALS